MQGLGIEFEKGVTPQFVESVVAVKQKSKA
jgi:hypothetical protein